MAKFVFVTGIPESGKDELLELVLKGSKRILPPFKCIKFEDILNFKQLGGKKSIGEMEKVRARFYQELEKQVGEAIKRNYNIILSGCFTIMTENGYVPVVSKEFFDIFRPDVIVMVEAYPKVQRLDYEYASQQDINRGYASHYSSISGALLKTIKVQQGEIKETIKELMSIIKFALGA
jgi:adenylate kinase